jgi:hypothetical protein
MRCVHAREPAQSSENQLEASAAALRGRGRPLPEQPRRALERASGRLLGHVRIHDDRLGGALADAVSARAVTIGGNIALGASAAGSSGVLAHELAHAAQLSGRPSGGPLALSGPGDAVEQAVRAGGSA